jgi:site-specific recombinase XerC
VGKIVGKAAGLASNAAAPLLFWLLVGSGMAFLSDDGPRLAIRAVTIRGSPTSVGMEVDPVNGREAHHSFVTDLLEASTV